MASDENKTIVDPAPSKFVQQALVVALVLIILGLLVFLFASVVAGGVIALLGIILGMGSTARI